MTKDKATEILFGIGKRLAYELGCNQTIEEDGNYGIWGDLGKKAWGEYKDITLHDGSGKRKGTSIELTYRFGHPKICVFGRNRDGLETLASIELSDGGYDEDGNYIHTGHWKFAESQVWRPEGAKMFLRLLRMWNEEGGE